MWSYILFLLYTIEPLRRFRKETVLIAKVPIFLVDIFYVPSQLSTPFMEYDR